MDGLENMASNEIIIIFHTFKLAQLTFLESKDVFKIDQLKNAVSKLN